MKGNTCQPEKKNVRKKWLSTLFQAGVMENKNIASEIIILLSFELFDLFYVMSSIQMSIFCLRRYRRSIFIIFSNRILVFV